MSDFFRSRSHWVAGSRVHNKHVDCRRYRYLCDLAVSPSQHMCAAHTDTETNYYQTLRTSTSPSTAATYTKRRRNNTHRPSADSSFSQYPLPFYISSVHDIVLTLASQISQAGDQCHEYSRARNYEFYCIATHIAGHSIEARTHTHSFARSTLALDVHRANAINLCAAIAFIVVAIAAAHTNLCRFN